jgi:hypothetical protein
MALLILPLQIFEDFWKGYPIVPVVAEAEKSTEQSKQLNSASGVSSPSKSLVEESPSEEPLPETPNHSPFRDQPKPPLPSEDIPDEFVN